MRRTPNFGVRLIEHEITTLKRQDKQELRCGAAKVRSTLMVYNAAIIDFQYADILLRLFEANLKTEENIQNSEDIKALQKDLAKRAEKAPSAGRGLPMKLYQALYLPTEVSLQFIHWLRVGFTRPTCTGFHSLKL